MPSEEHLVCPAKNILITATISIDRRTDPVSWFARTFPSPNFYCRFWWYVYRSSRLAQQGKYDGAAWSLSSHDVLRALELVGVNFEVSGVENLRKLDSPCVIVGNHMSMLETITFPVSSSPCWK